MVCGTKDATPPSPSITKRPLRANAEESPFVLMGVASVSQGKAMKGLVVVEAPLVTAAIAGGSAGCCGTTDWLVEARHVVLTRRTHSRELGCKC